MNVPAPKVLVIALAGSLAALGCNSGSDAAPSVLRSKDVRVACEQRAEWTKPTTVACDTCIAEVKQPTCDCQPMSGKCRSETESAIANCETSVLACANNCVSDCACVDACFAGLDACRAAAGTMDGCIAATCEEACR